MFESLIAPPADPLLKLITDFNQDPNPNKVDLGVGVYRDSEGRTPVLNVVKMAETQLVNEECSKAYLGSAGNLDYGMRMADLVFGGERQQLGERIAHIQTPGGCGALRLIAELAVRTPSRTLWVSDPTWANHVPLMSSAGLAIVTYPYYDFTRQCLNFEAMIDALSTAKNGDIVLLHGCCHNPSGADLSATQWQTIIDLCERLGLVPLIDLAYQGFADSVDSDAYGVRLAASKLPELMVAVSCSKTFGLYRERVGSAFVVTKNSSSARAVFAQLAAVARGIYSMPPAHGAAVVAKILADQKLRESWELELGSMRERIQLMRSQLCHALRESLGSSTFDFIEREHGMFSFLGINEQQVATLARNHSIYMASSSRINVAGLNDRSISLLVRGLKSVI